MEYKPVTAVWEITMGCNMRCKHCGSACTTPLPDELTTDEALALCGDLGKLGFQWITLSGGEPFTRPDWHVIAEGLHQNGVIANVISNGWLVTEKIVKLAADAHVNTVAVSIDGTRETHDLIRKPGSFDRIMVALDLMRNGGVHRAAITTVNNKNLAELPLILKILEDKGVETWQLQLGLPMGTMALNRELVADTGCVDAIIAFAHAHYDKTPVDIQLADCIGYYNAKEMEVRRKGKIEEGYDWQGCGAGKTGMGILHNGDIVGCTSIRKKEFIEGSIKKRSIIDIWNDPDSFEWNRDLKKDDLSGFCGRCKYGSVCLGGCGNTRLVMSDSILGENKYCSYSHAFSIAEARFASITETKDLAARARVFIDKGNHQLAESLLRRGLEIAPGDRELLGLFGYASYRLENYAQAKAANEAMLASDATDPYANKGMGLTLCKMDRLEEGVAYLRKAIDLADENFMGPVFRPGARAYGKRQKGRSDRRSR